MTRDQRNRRSTLPVSRNRPVPVLGSSTAALRSTTPVSPGLGKGIKKGVVRGHHRGSTFDRTSMNYSTSATIDKSWDRTVSDFVSGIVPGQS